MQSKEVAVALGNNTTFVYASTALSAHSAQHVVQGVQGYEICDYYEQVIYTHSTVSAYNVPDRMSTPTAHGSCYNFCIQ